MDSYDSIVHDFYNKDRIEIKLNILPDDNPIKTAKNNDNLDGF